MVSIDVLVIAAGIIYGYIRPGKEDRSKILRNGLKWGLTLGVILAVLGLLLKRSLVAITAGVGGIFLVLVVAFVITVEFIIGTLIGDFLEEKLKK